MFVGDWGGGSHNPPTGEHIFCLIQTCVYFPHVDALMHDSDMIDVSIIHTLSLNIFPSLCSSLLLCFSLLPSDFSFCFGKGAFSNIPEEKQRTCIQLYSDVNNTNLCFRTTTSYDRMEGPGLQNGLLVLMNLCAKQ